MSWQVAVKALLVYAADQIEGSMIDEKKVKVSERNTCICYLELKSRRGYGVNLILGQSFGTKIFCPCMATHMDSGSLQQ